MEKRPQYICYVIADSLAKVKQMTIATQRSHLSERHRDPFPYRHACSHRRKEATAGHGAL